MSPGAAAGHTKLTGMIFFQNGCDTGARVFASRTFTIATQPQPAAVLTSGSLANGATYVAGGLVPGSWARVKGTGLANVTRLWTGFDFLGLGSNLPKSLSGVQVMVNNLPAAVYYISPTQVNFQVPTGITGNASVQVINNGAMSNTITAASAASAPGLFPNTVNGVNYPAAVPDGTLVGNPAASSADRNAKPGRCDRCSTLPGLVAEPGGVLPTAQGIPGVTVTVGTVTLPADFAGQTPYVGEFENQFHRPAAIRRHARGKLSDFNRCQRRLIPHHHQLQPSGAAGAADSTLRAAGGDIKLEQRPACRTSSVKAREGMTARAVEPGAARDQARSVTA